MRGKRERQSENNNKKAVHCTLYPGTRKNTLEKEKVKDRNKKTHRQSKGEFKCSQKLTSHPGSLLCGRHRHSYMDVDRPT